MNLLGISRSPKFSPGSADRDAAIFAATSSRLARRHDVSLISEELFIAVDLSEFDGVFSMARSAEVLSSLAAAEERGLRVVNSASALLSATRAALTLLMTSLQTPMPRSLVLRATPAQSLLSAYSQLEAEATPSFPLWLKRGDACAQEAADTQYVETPAALSSALQQYAERGIASAVLSEHLEGDLVKFYGVEGTDFFFHTLSTEGGHVGKFGLERHNGAPRGFAFSPAQLKHEADRLARAAGLQVYGGDAVVSASGTVRIIDFNDWPSFSPCRKEAARAIASLF